MKVNQGAPLEVLQSTTMVGAAAIGVGRTLGSIDVGKIADLVVYRADSTADIRALRNVRGVSVPMARFNRGRRSVRAGDRSREADQ